MINDLFEEILTENTTSIKDEPVIHSGDNIQVDNAGSQNDTQTQDNNNSIGPQSGNMFDLYPKMDYSGVPDEYISLVKKIQNTYLSLPRLKYDDLYTELSELTIKAVPTPTLQVLNDEIQKVQAAKDRLSEILIEVIKCFNIKQRCVDILTESWGKFTNEKNAEARKGDASFRLNEFIVDFAYVEALYKACYHIFKNLDSLHETLSRRITIYQLTIKLNDIGRGALPESEYSKRYNRGISGEEMQDKYTSSNSERKSDGSIGAEKVNF